MPFRSPIPWRHGHALLSCTGIMRGPLDPREQVSTFELLGTLPVTDRDTVLEFGLGSVFSPGNTTCYIFSFHLILYCTYKFIYQ